MEEDEKVVKDDSLRNKIINRLIGSTNLLRIILYQCSVRHVGTFIPILD